MIREANFKELVEVAHKEDEDMEMHVDEEVRDLTENKDSRKDFSSEENEVMIISPKQPEKAFLEDEWLCDNCGSINLMIYDDEKSSDCFSKLFQVI